MGHEYLHVAFFASGFRNKAKHHASIYSWKYEQAKVWNYNVERVQSRYELSKKYLDKRVDYTKMGMYVLPIVIFWFAAPSANMWLCL